MNATMQMSRMPKSLVGFAALPLALCAAAGLAETPKVLDHVPAGTAAYAVMPNVGDFLSGLSQLNTALAGKLPPDAAQLGLGLFFAQSIVNQPGFDSTGSAAVIIGMPEGGFEAGEPTITTLLPIADLEAFAKSPFMSGQNAKFANGSATVTMEGNTLHMRDIGEFTVASNDPALVEGFAPGEFLAAHTTALGDSGVSALNGTDLAFVLSVAEFDQYIEEMVASAEQQVNFLAMMGGGEQVTQGFTMFKDAVNIIRRDGSVGVFTMNAGEAGVALDMGVSFRADTESAKTFSAALDSGALLDALPNENFLIASAFDSSSEGLKKLLGGFAVLAGNAGGMGGLGAAIAGSTGGSSMIGTSPAAMGGAGLMSKQISYSRSADPKSAMSAMADSLKEMNGQSMMGMKFATSYEKATTEIAGVSVDSYSTKMSADGGAGGAGNPMAMMMDPAMITSMMYGMSGGPSGYVAAVDGGYYTTSAKNSSLLESAIKAGRAGEGLGENAMLSMVSSNLQAGRFGEAYIALDQAFNTFGPFAQMLGMLDAFEPLKAVPPLGLSAVGDGGGLMARMYWPAETIGMLLETAEAMDAGGMMGGDAEAEPEF